VSYTTKITRGSSKGAWKKKRVGIGRGKAWFGSIGGSDGKEIDGRWELVKGVRVVEFEVP